MVPALLKWIGNKQRFAETIISYMPETFNNYYEPFLGSGAVLAMPLLDSACGIMTRMSTFDETAISSEGIINK